MAFPASWTDAQRRYAQRVAHRLEAAVTTIVAERKAAWRPGIRDPRQGVISMQADPTVFDCLRHLHPTSRAGRNLAATVRLAGQRIPVHTHLPVPVDRVALNWPGGQRVIYLAPPEIADADATLYETLRSDGLDVDAARVAVSALTA